MAECCIVFTVQYRAKHKPEPQYGPDIQDLSTSVIKGDSDYPKT